MLLAALGRSDGEWGAQELGILDMAAGGPHCSVSWSAFPGQQGWEEECSSVLRWRVVGQAWEGHPQAGYPEAAAPTGILTLPRSCSQVRCHLLSPLRRLRPYGGASGTRVPVTPICSNPVWGGGILDRLANKHSGQGQQVDRPQCHRGTEDQYPALRPAGVPPLSAAHG